MSADAFDVIPFEVGAHPVDMLVLVYNPSLRTLKVIGRSLAPAPLEMFIKVGLRLFSICVSPNSHG